MKVIQIQGSDHVYSSNAYLILGDWKRIEDINTLIDTGSDPAIIQTIEKLNTGIGKSKVEQVIITHNHSDHTAALPLIRQAFNPVIYSFTPFLDGVDRVLKNGDRLRIGDRMCEIIHTPGHSSDSICIYIEDEGILFAGDTPLVIRSSGGVYESDYVVALKDLCRRDIRKIYFGHGEPVLNDARCLLEESLKNVRSSLRVETKISPLSFVKDSP
ncbi:MAG: Hydroxyacylglutathione hydrolase [Syntrophus sp. SKADARSKE-3]|nr:Hydroxyacylglutathione hydrolase [Syntrophus sp. SKADARSKE-3]